MKNIHLEHPEDEILTGNLTVLDWFYSAGTLSVKIDGAPAIVWGIDPACGEFFVGTKAVFNKKKIRIAHNHEEIDAFYQGEVASILHSCFDYLPRTDTVYQGDFIGFGGSTEYRSNLITYKFPEVVTQEIIIAPHTCYYAEKDLRDAVAMPDRAIWNDSDTVKYVKPDAWVVHNQESFADVKEVCDYARQMSTLVNFVSDKEAAKIKVALNACIREGREINSKEFGCDYLLIEFWKLVKSIKEDCLYLCRCDGPEAYIGQDRIVAEGFVLSNEFGMFKLVNREVFSKANFNQGRFQQAV
jgi:hypothetical protein